MLARMTASASGHPTQRLVNIGLCMVLLSCGGGGGSPAPSPAVSPAPAPAPAPVPPPPAPSDVVVSGPSPVATGCGISGAAVVFTNAEVEPMVATSPANPNQLVAAWQQDRAANGGARAVVSAVSSDGGRSWSRTLQPMSRCGGAAAGSAGDFERSTDPWVDIGIDGTLHLMALGFNGGALLPGSASAMLASRSTDGGVNWSPPTVLQHDGAALFNDKNTLTADPTDARYVYAVWDRIDSNDNGPTLFARSVNAGLSWEPARTIYTPTTTTGPRQTIGNRIVVITEGAERGVLVNVFVQIDNNTTTRLRGMRSVDKGQTWDAPVTVADMQSVGTRDPDSNAVVRDGALVPTVAAGPGGMLWLAWQDARFSGGLRDAIALSRSADGGRSWGAPVAVNRDASVAAFTPTLHVRADGRIGLLHYDLRSNTASTASLLADLWLLSSSDGVTWTETAVKRAFNLATAPTASNGALFLGDYQGLTSSGNVFVPLAVLPNADLNNRTDVIAQRIESLTANSQQALTRFGARAELPTISPGQREAFAAAHAEATRRALQLRRPGPAPRAAR